MVPQAAVISRANLTPAGGVHVANHSGESIYGQFLSPVLFAAVLCT